MIKLFLAGDVMTGRGIDQILPHSVDPRLHEPYVKDARGYVRLAEEANGPIPQGVGYDYVWGDGLAELAARRPDARIINLETAVTKSSDCWRGKSIHYRMHPENVRLLSEAQVDICVLANNHVIDWGRAGLQETLAAIASHGIQTCGAGSDKQAAQKPAALDLRPGRLLAFAYGSPSAGVPDDWSSRRHRPGVNLLADFGPGSAQKVIAQVEGARAPGDRVLISLHWGGNWGYEVTPAQREFAHRLLDAGVADVIYGHSSHHPKGIEVYRGRLILYGCGDLINDYEGIRGHEEFRPELSLMYFVELADSGQLASLEMTPMRIRRFRLERASEEEGSWLRNALDRESRKLGARVEETSSGRLALRWG